MDSNQACRICSGKYDKRIIAVLVFVILVGIFVLTTSK